MEFKDAIKKEKMLIIKFLLANKQYDIALTTLNELRKKNEHDLSILAEIAKVQIMKVDLEGSMRTCIYILDILNNVEGKNTKLQKGGVYVLIATIYSKQGNMESYNEYMNKALGCGLPSEQIFSHKAATFEGQKDFDSAIEFYEKALIKDKTSLIALTRLYTIYLNKSDIEKCFEVADRIINNCKNYKGYHFKFNLYLKLNDKVKAFFILEEAKAIFGDLDEIKTDYIKIFLLSERYDDALELINTVNSDSESYIVFMVQKANIYVGKGEAAKALEVMNEIYDSKNVMTVFQMGLVKLFGKDFEGAIKEFDLIEKSDVLQNLKDLSLILKGRAIKDSKSKAETIAYFEKLNEVFKEKCSENPKDIQSRITRILAFVECEKFVDAKRLLREVEAEEIVEKSILDNLKDLILDRENGEKDDKNFFSGIIF